MDKRCNLIALIISALILASCNQHSNQPPQIGSFDSTAIAGDTMSQRAIEESYEFNRTLVVNPNEVYDVVVWGKPSIGSMCFIYRNKQGVLDTILKTQRIGMVKECWLSDLNKNKLPEIILVLQNTDRKKLETIAGYEITKDRKIDSLKFNVQLLKQYVQEYKGNDSIYYTEKDNSVYHEFPLMDSTKAIGRAKIRYLLKGDKFEAQSFEVTDTTGKTKSIF
jgi:hypothetical protein